MNEPDWNYTRAPLTPTRLYEIRELALLLRQDALHDIEDKRDLYRALLDLLAHIEDLRA